MRILGALCLLVVAGCCDGAGCEEDCGGLTCFEGDQLIVDGEHLYYQEGGQIRRMGKRGGDVAVVARVEYEKSNPGSLTVSGDDVFWLHAPGTLYRAPRAGGEARLVASGVDAYAVDAQNVYYTTARNFIDLSRIEYRIVQRPRSGGDAITIAADQPARALVLGDGWIYWLNHSASDFGIRRAPIGGGRMDHVLDDRVFWLRIDRDRLLWCTIDLYSSRLDGSDALRLGDACPWRVFGEQMFGVVDNDAVRVGEKSPRLWRALLGGEPEVFLTASGSLDGLAIDAEAIYWIDYGHYFEKRALGSTSGWRRRLNWLAR